VVCLDAAYPGRQDLWHGWLVSAETDYATEWDVLLTEADGPCDPIAGMVQLWNPVYAYLPSTGRVLAQLRPERVAALRAVAAEFLGGADTGLMPHPGHVGARETLDGHVVLTGTPLGGADDPRHRYRTLYRAATAALHEPVKLALDAARAAARQPGLLERWRTALAGLGVAWQPAPALKHAMDAASPGTGPMPLEGILAKRLRLSAEWHGDLLELVAHWLEGPPLHLEVSHAGEVTESHRLGPDQPRQTLRLDGAEVLTLREDDGAVIARLPLEAG
jgi:hypothetical protein